MISRKLALLSAFGVLTFFSVARAATVTFVTPTGSTAAGNPVSASATFTTGSGTLSITLTNLESNPKDVAQNISDLFFTLSGNATTGSSLTSSGQDVTVNSNKTFTLGSTVSTGWVLDDATGPTFHLNGLGAAADVPAHTIIGPPGGTTYANANGSIAGNGPHNPFINQTATFSMNILGVTVDTTVTAVTFSFGTTAGSNVDGETPPSHGPTVPLPSSLLMGAVALAGVGAWRGLVRWRAARR